MIYRLPNSPAPPGRLATHTPRGRCQWVGQPVYRGPPARLGKARQLGGTRDTDADYSQHDRHAEQQNRLVHWWALKEGKCDHGCPSIIKVFGAATVESPRRAIGWSALIPTP